MRVQFDWSAQCAFVESLAVAGQRAALEAVNTAGIVTPVHAIEVGQPDLNFILDVPNFDLEVQSASGRGRVAIKALGLGKFYLTFGSLTGTTDPIGFLVVRPKIKAWGEPSLMEAEVLRAVMNVSPVGLALPAGQRLGPVCCGICNFPISSGRLAAVRNTKVCTRCREKDEQEYYYGDLDHAYRHHARY